MIVAAHQTMLAPQGAPLPYDAEIEYLQSTGGQWIDMGVGPTTGAIAFGYTISGYGSGAGVFGQQKAGDRVLLWIDSAASGYLDLGSSGSRISYSSADFSRTKTAYDAPSEPAPRYLYTTANSNGSARTTRALVQLRYFQLWDENDVLVRDFIPVRVGTTGYLYDRANPTGGPNGNGLFGNAGTGAFTIGPDKT